MEVLIDRYWLDKVNAAFQVQTWSNSQESDSRVATGGYSSWLIVAEMTEHPTFRQASIDVL